METKIGLLIGKITARPVIPLAVIMTAALVLTYETVSIIPSLIICVLLAAAGIAVRKLGKYKLFIAGICAFVLICCIPMTMTLSGEHDTGLYDGTVTVTSVVKRLSGNNRVFVRLDGGAGAVMYCSDEDTYPPGSLMHVQGRITESDNATNPGEFDRREYLKEKGILYVMTPEHIICSRGVYEDIFHNARKYILNAVSGQMDEDTKALLAAICLGDTSLLSDRMTSGFKLAGCSHLIAVSGSHFAGFLVFITFAADRFIGGRQKRHVMYKVLLSASYLALGFLTGFGDSVTRACIMCICLVFARDRLSGMCFAAVIMMVADPFTVMSSGFRFSMAAALGILLFAGRLKEKIPDILAYALSAHIGLLPFYSCSSVRFSPLNIVCQMAGGVIVSLICVSFIPTLILSVITGMDMSYGLELLIIILKELVVKTAGLSYLSVNCGRFSSLVFIGLFVLVIVLLMPDSVLRRICLAPAAASGGLCLGLLLYGVLFPPALTVVFIDVGQGDSCLIMTPSCSILIDGGEDDRGKTVADVLDWYGIDKVDAAFVSHWDSDHAGGIRYLYGEGRISSVFAPCPDSLNGGTAVSSACILGYGSDVIIGDLAVSVLHPDESLSDGNEDSLVLSVSHNGKVMLFTGDIGTETEELLLSEGRIPDCDILKVAHHGSRFSSENAFLEASSPGIAVISCGRNNNYGHPSPETLARLQQAQAVIRRTDTEGAVELVFEK